MKILITGGAGFIGSHLSASLKDLGHNVILCDLPGKFSDYQKSKFSTIECDVSNIQQVNTLPSCDAVYHLAGQVGTAGSLKDPNLDLKWNAEGTLNIVNFSIKNKVKILIHASSMAIYGNAPFAREISVPAPISPYGISKVCSENYVNYAQHVGAEIRCITFRIFNCYGPGQSTKNLSKGLASIFLEQVKRGNDIYVTGDLSRTRDLIYIDDVINALVLPLINKEVTGIYNICSGMKTTIRDLIKKIVEISGKDFSDIKIRNTDTIPEDPVSVVGDNSRLKKHGWLNNVSLDKGLSICWSNT